MKHFARIFLVITLIAAMLALSVSAVAPIASTTEKTGWSAGSAMTDENDVMIAYRSPAGHDPNGVLSVTYQPTSPIDISKYIDDGYFHLMIYVNNPDALSTNGQIELTSSGKCDVEELHWAVPAGDLEQGWNEVFLPLDEADDNGANPEAINYFRFYWFPADGGDVEELGDPYFAIADLHVAFYGDDITYPNGNIQWNQLTYFDMTNFAGAKTDLAGTTTVSSTSDSLCLMETGTIATPIDLSKYEDGGYMHVWMYIEGVDNFTGDVIGQFELTSSGKCDTDELHFAVTADELHDGWNEIIWCFDDAEEANADLSAINYIRFYKHVSGSTTVTIREIAFGTEEEMDMVPETEPPATEPPATDAPETDAPTGEGEEVTGEAAIDDDSADSPASNTTTYIIIAVIAAVVIVLAVIAIAASKKKKK